MCDVDEKQPSYVPFLLTVFAGACVVFAASMVIGLAVGADPGSFADWLAAVSTLAAFGAAVVAARYAAGAFDLESVREQRWVDNERSSQARQVAAWAGVKEVENRASGSVPGVFDKLFESGILPRTSTLEGVYLRNASDLPVTQVSIRLFLADEPAGRMRLGVIPPAGVPLFVRTPNEMKVPANPEVLDIDGAEPTVGLAFVDAAGRQWCREPDGTFHDSWPAWVTEDLRAADAIDDTGSRENDDQVESS